MVNFGPDFKNKNALSASKLEKFRHCSQSYYCNYILKLPDRGNAGSLKGDVIHNILELLSKRAPKRDSLVCEVIRNNTCRNSAALWKLIKRYADKNRVGIESELDIIDQYILVALNNEFYGPKGATEVLIEKAFDFEVVEQGKSFRIRGFLDKIILFIHSDGTMEAQIVDYKSSKAKFAAKKLAESIQGSIYQICLKYMFPKYKLTKFTFLFLKFPKEPRQEFELLSDSALDGFEYLLSNYQKQINAFGIINVGDNLGVTKYETKALCGPAKSGWICPHQKPFYYYVVLAKDNSIVKSAFTKAELTPKADEKIERRWYGGCVAFHDTDTGAPRKLNFRGE